MAEAVQGAQGKVQYPPPPVDWIVLQEKWMQMMGFRFAEWNFYPSLKKVKTFGSEFEQATDYQRSNLEASPIFKMLLAFFKTKKYPVKCQCHVGNDGKKCNDDTCDLRTKFVECSALCGDQCCNRRIQKKQFVSCLKYGVIHPPGKSLISTDKITKGTWLVEFIGIVSTGKPNYKDEHAYPIIEARGSWETRLGIKIKYRNFFINALKYSNEAHFIRHNENPNCEIMQWWVPMDNYGEKHHVRLIVVAKDDIPPGQQITLRFPQHETFSSADPSLTNEDDVKEQEFHEEKAKKEFFKIPESGISGGLLAKNELKRRLAIGYPVKEVKFRASPQPLYNLTIDEDYDTDESRPGVKFFNAQLRKAKIETAEQQKPSICNAMKLFCKYEKEGKKLGDDGYAPCYEEFNNVLDFRAHINNDHKGKYGCRYYGCGMVYDTKDEARLHFIKRHNPNVQVDDELKGNDAELFLPYFRDRLKHGANREGREDILLYHDKKVEPQQLSAAQRQTELTKIQDYYEMEQFKKMIISAADNVIQNHVERILEQSRQDKSIEEHKSDDQNDQIHTNGNYYYDEEDPKMLLHVSENQTAATSNNLSKQGEKSNSCSSSHDDDMNDKDYIQAKNKD